MSAWIVSNDHLRYMVAAARMLGVDLPEGATTSTEAGRILLAVNIASVSYRYNADLEDLPGPAQKTRPEDFCHDEIGGGIDYWQALKCADSYDYQSCEHPGWEASTAYRFCQRLVAALCAALEIDPDTDWQRTVDPRYVAAEWDYDPIAN